MAGTIKLNGKVMGRKGHGKEGERGIEERDGGGENIGVASGGRRTGPHN